MLAIHEDVAIPSAYLLSNSKETDNYETFYRTIQKETKKLMSPKGVLLDFEEALSKGFTNVFPNAAVYRDFFHFVQAKCEAVLGFKSKAKDLVPDLNKLWYAPSKERHKRMMLKHYVDPKANLLLRVDVDATMEVNGIASPCLTTIPSPSLLASPISLPFITKHEKKRRRTRKPLLPHEICPTCNESKRHQECSLRLCKYCCCSSTEKCSLTDHNRSKVGARKPFAEITNVRSDPRHHSTACLCRDDLCQAIHSTHLDSHML